MVRSDLPFGSEFSPSQIDLIRVLEMAAQHEGDWRALEDAIRSHYFVSHPTSEYNRRKLANNCKLGMIAYRLIERDGSLTQLGRELLSLAKSPDRLYQLFAKHILLNLKGLVVVQTVQDMQARGEKVSLRNLRSWLEERGVHFPRGGKHPSILRLWLEKAGVVAARSWDVDGARLEEILGAPASAIEQLSMLTTQQKAYLRTLGNMGGPGPYLSNDIEKMATTTYGAKFDEKNLPKTVLYPLRDAGYIALERGTKQAGRGAKPFQITLGPRIAGEVIAPIIAALEAQAHPDLRPMLRKSLTDILADLISADRHVKGLALEALAFYLMRLIDLTYVATRLRGEATGGAEVDLIFEGARLIFSRWQILCRDTPVISLDDAATAVGLMIHSRSHVAILIGTRAISDAARKYARLVREQYGKQLIIAGREELLRVATGATSFRQLLEDQAPVALARAG